MTHEKLDEILVELRQQLEAIYGERLAHVILFGSQARGDAEPDSDIDVLVVLYGKVNHHQEIKRTSQVISDLSLKYDTVVSRVFIPFDRFQLEQSSLLRNVRREGVLVQ